MSIIFFSLIVYPIIFLLISRIFYIYKKYKFNKKVNIVEKIANLDNDPNNFNDVITTINNNINNIEDEKIREEFLEKVNTILSKYNSMGDYSNLDELRDLSLLIAIYLLGQYTTNENIMRNVRNELNKEG